MIKLIPDQSSSIEVKRHSMRLKRNVVKGAIHMRYNVEDVELWWGVVNNPGVYVFVIFLK